MEFDGLSCALCKNNYDTKTFLPRIFPSCGHTFCSQCFLKFFQNNSDNRIRCPIDNISYSIAHKTISDFPVNYVISSLLEGKECKWGFCKVHNKEMEFICLCNRFRICGECAVLGSHQGHKVKLLEKLYQEVNEKTDFLEASIDQLKIFSKNLLSTLDLEKETIIISLKSKFEILGHILKKKEDELISDLNNLFQKEKNEVRNKIGNNSSFVKKIEKNIQTLKDHSSEFNLVDVLEEDIGAKINLESDSFENDCFAKCQTKLKELSTFLNSSINFQIQTLEQLKVPDKGFIIDYQWLFKREADYLEYFNRRPQIF